MSLKMDIARFKNVEEAAKSLGIYNNNEVKGMSEFKKDLEVIINKHSIENKLDMPDFLIAEMLCNIIDGMSSPIKRNLDWHGCDSTYHPLDKEQGE